MIDQDNVVEQIRRQHNKGYEASGGNVLTFVIKNTTSLRVNQPERSSELIYTVKQAFLNYPQRRKSSFN